MKTVYRNLALLLLSACADTTTVSPQQIDTQPSINEQFYQAPADILKANFKKPPEQVNPWVYWYWVSNNISKTGIEKDLAAMQKAMGWKLLVNQNEIIEVDGDRIAVVGIENWGAKARFPKYGNLSEAIKGTENIDTKLLLSHDPSHWQAEVLPLFPDISATFSGHTHGMQFGVDIPGIKWSPVQYVYDEWAGLYQQKGQYLYVNRGFGYIGYPGRIGMPPEITTIELVSA